VLGQPLEAGLKSESFWTIDWKTAGKRGKELLALLVFSLRLNAILFLSSSMPTSSSIS
jgi:hypothetical protein